MELAKTPERILRERNIKRYIARKGVSGESRFFAGFTFCLGLGISYLAWAVVTPIWAKIMLGFFGFGCCWVSTDWVRADQRRWKALSAQPEIGEIQRLQEIQRVQQAALTKLGVGDEESKAQREAIAALNPLIMQLWIQAHVKIGAVELQEDALTKIAHVCTSAAQEASGLLQQQVQTHGGGE